MLSERKEIMFISNKHKIIKNNNKFLNKIKLRDNFRKVHTFCVDQCLFLLAASKK